MMSLETTTIEVSRDALVAGLTALADVVNPKPVVVYGHVLFEAQDGKQTVRATDGTASARAVMDAATPVSLPLCLPYRELAAFARALPQGMVTIETKQDSAGRYATVSNGSSRLRIGGLPASDFPLWREPTGTEAGTLKAGAARELLQRAAACSLDIETGNVRPGPQITIKGPQLFVEGTDGHRLLVAGPRVDDGASILLPKRTLGSLCKALAADDDADVVVTIGDDWCWWVTPTLTFALLRLAGKGPNIRRILDARKRGVAVDIKADDLRRAMARIAVIVSKGHITVRVTGEAPTLTLSITTPDGSVTEPIPGDFIGGRLLPPDLGMSARYIAAAPDLLAGETLRLAVQPSGTDVVTWTCPDDPHSAEYLVMPMRA